MTEQELQEIEAQANAATCPACTCLYDTNQDCRSDHGAHVEACTTVDALVAEVRRLQTLTETAAAALKEADVQIEEGDDEIARLKETIATVGAEEHRAKQEWRRAEARVAELERAPTVFRDQLTEARNDALEEAARVSEETCGGPDNCYEAIRALKKGGPK